MLRSPMMRRAARVISGYYVTSGSGRRTSPRILLRKLGLPAVAAAVALPTGGAPRVISLLIPFLMPKRKIERESSVNCYFGRNFLEQRGIRTYSGRAARG
jgi:hypothetical protein